jgi:hypothetical protein
MTGIAKVSFPTVLALQLFLFAGLWRRNKFGHASPGRRIGFATLLLAFVATFFGGCSGNSTRASITAVTVNATAGGQSATCTVTISVKK